MGSSPSEKAAWGINQSVPTASRHCCRQGDTFAMLVMLGYNVAILCHDLALYCDLLLCLRIFYTVGTLLSPLVYPYVNFISCTFSPILTRLISLNSIRPFSILLPLCDLQMESSAEVMINTSNFSLP